MQLPFYVMVQIGGSVLACLSVNGIMKPHEEHFYGTVPMIGHTKLPFLMEFLGSSVLMIVIATVARGSVVRACYCPKERLVSGYLVVSSRE